MSSRYRSTSCETATSRRTLARSFTTGKRRPKATLFLGPCPKSCTTRVTVTTSRKSRVSYRRTKRTAIRCERRDVPDEAYFDGRIAKLAVQALGECAQKSGTVLSWRSDFGNHICRSIPPKRYWELYKNEDIPRPESPDWPKGTPRIAWHDSRELLRALKGKTLKENEAQEIRRGYLAAISYLDAQVGKVIAELDRLKLTDSTVIVFWSDHGFHLGDHTLWAKTSNFELDARVPLLIVPPKRLTAESPRKTDAIVELLDLYPTLADLCGLPKPSGVEGVSLRPILDGTKTSIKPAALSQHPRPAYFKEIESLRVMGHSIRTPKFRYTEWTDVSDGSLVGSELYDHSIDECRVREPSRRFRLRAAIARVATSLA